MGRVVLCWELGSNLGHLSRLLPLAVELRKMGREVLVAVRDLGLATELLAPSGIPFVQAPRMGEALSEDRRPTSYADVLLLQGWGSAAGLWGAVQAWGNLLRLARASVVVADYSPTVLLATRIMKVPSAVIGTGFELPPLDDPIPAFPGTATLCDQADIAAVEARVLAAANEVLNAYGTQQLRDFRELLRTERRWLTTFAELDQYGVRAGEMYIGPIGSLDRAQPAFWPDGFSQRVLAYLRPNTPGLVGILKVLASRSELAVICAVPGLSAESLKLPTRPGFQFFSRPVSFASLLPQASLFVSYGPAASVTQSLLKGVPQLISPVHVEAQLTAVRVLAMGAGLAFRGDASVERIDAALTQLLSDPRFRFRAVESAARYRDFDSDRVVARLATDLEALAAGESRKSAAAG